MIPEKMELNNASLEQEEQQLMFSSFSRSDALALALIINKKAGERFSDPLTIEITVNGLVVFRYFPDGSRKDSELWMVRKRNSVELMEMSSLRFKYWLEAYGATLEDRKLAPDDYAAGGGGYPINIRGTGCIGSICVSGLPNHVDDHMVVVDSIREYNGLS